MRFVCQNKCSCIINHSDSSLEGLIAIYLAYPRAVERNFLEQEKSGFFIDVLGLYMLNHYMFYSLLLVG